MKKSLLTLLTIVVLFYSLVAEAQYHIRFNFTQAQGDMPSAGLALGANDVLFNSTSSDGSGGCTSGPGYGSVGYYDTTTKTGGQFYHFCNSAFAGSPGQIIVDNSGVIWGSTSQGGDATCQCGVLFKLVCSGTCPESGTWTLTVLHKFVGGSNDGYGSVWIALDSSGNIFGTSTSGGNSCVSLSIGTCGLVFEYSSAGVYSILYKFSANGGPAAPGAAPIIDGNGIIGNEVLYGTSLDGGIGAAPGFGTVWSLTPVIIGPGDTVWMEKTIYKFTGVPDGLLPWGSLYLSGSTLYGTTFGGGNGGNTCLFFNTDVSCGTVYKVTLTGTETILHNFSGSGTDGYEPVSNLTVDSSGNFYGTTRAGGTSGSFGTVFEITSGGTYSQLHQFSGPTSDGAYPGPSVTPIGTTLWGLTSGGGNCGGGSGSNCGILYSWQ